MTPRGTRPGSYSSAPRQRSGPSEEPDLISEVRRRLATGEPLDLLAEASSLVAAVDQRRQSPFDRSRGEGSEGPSLDELTITFAEVDIPETAALLAAVAQLAPDELVRARAKRALRSRMGRVPGWLEHLGETEVYRAVAMVHVLGDGDDNIVAVRLPDQHELTVIVYIDHNLGTVVKDAFVVPGPITEVLDLMRANIEEDSDVEWHEISLQDIRARIVEAMRKGDMLFPPLETETWPACQPIIEWIARLLPDGGTGYIRQEWSDSARRQLTKRFFSSPEGARLDDRDHRGLFESLLWFGTDYGPGDPMRWSPVSVEILLDDWIPRKIVADAEFLSKAPELLRSFIRFCHAERGIRRELTDLTLDAVDRYEPEYQRVIRSPRPQGPAALLAAMGALDPDELWDDDEDEYDEYDYETVMRELLEDAVGGARNLDRLNTKPLPDEQFVWTKVPDDVRERVAEVLAICDRCCDELLDVEYRTACRRLLARVAAGNPDFFRRRGRSDTAAAALCFLVGKANYLFSAHRGGMSIKNLMEHFRLSQGSVSQRAGSLLKGTGIPLRDRYGDFTLASPELLVSARRRNILEARDRLT